MHVNKLYRLLSVRLIYRYRGRVQAIKTKISIVAFELISIYLIRTSITSYHSVRMQYYIYGLFQ